MKKMLSRKVRPGILAGFVMLIVVALGNTTLWADWQQDGGSLNQNLNAHAINAQVICADGIQYVAWEENGNIFAKVWNGSSWQFIGGSINGNNGAFRPRLAVANGIPYVSYTQTELVQGEKTRRYYSLFVKKWDGTSWVTIKNFGHDQISTFPVNLVVYQNKLNLTLEGSCEQWEGTQWTIRPRPDTGLPLGSTYGSTIYVDPVCNRLYMTYPGADGTFHRFYWDEFWASWSDEEVTNYTYSLAVYNGMHYQLRYNGNQLCLKDPVGNLTYLNRDSTATASSADIKVSAGGVFVTWQENGKIYCSRLNNGILTSLGDIINVNVNNYATSPRLALNGDTPIIVWNENNGYEQIVEKHFVDLTTHTPTNTPTLTPTPAITYFEDFDGANQTLPAGWRDQSNSQEYNATVRCNGSGEGVIQLLAVNTYGDVMSSPMQNLNIQIYNTLEIKFDDISASGYLDVGLQEESGAHRYFPLFSHITTSGVSQVNLSTAAANADTSAVTLKIWINGTSGVSQGKIDYIRIFHSDQSTPTPTKTPTPFFQWKETFNRSDDVPTAYAGAQPPGWYDQRNNASFNAMLMYSNTDGLAELNTCSGAPWGKVLSFSQNVDLSVTPILGVTVSGVPYGTFKIAVFSQADGWEEHVLTGSLNQPGQYAFNLPELTGWSGVKNMGVELIVEGANGTVVLDSVLLRNGGTSLPLATFTPTPTITPGATPEANAWVEVFAGTPGVKPSNWMDESNNPGFNAWIGYGTFGWSANVSRTATGTWGKVLSPIIDCDVDSFNEVQLNGHLFRSLKIGIQEIGGTWQYWDIGSCSRYEWGSITRSFDYKGITGWTGRHQFRLQITVEGNDNCEVFLKWIRVCRAGTVYGASASGTEGGKNVLSLASATSTPTISPTPMLTATPVSTLTPTPTVTATPWAAEGQVTAFPNPARGRVTFGYTLRGIVKVTIDIYRLTGERVARIEERQDGGAGQTLTSVWDAVSVAPGVYFCRIVATDVSGKEVLNVKKKVALVK